MTPSASFKLPAMETTWIQKCITFTEFHCIGWNKQRQRYWKARKWWNMTWSCPDSRNEICSKVQTFTGTPPHGTVFPNTSVKAYWRTILYKKSSTSANLSAPQSDILQWGAPILLKMTFPLYIQVRKVIDILSAPQSDILQWGAPTLPTINIPNAFNKIQNSSQPKFTSPNSPNITAT